jgi:hypothetical protein
MTSGSGPEVKSSAGDIAGLARSSPLGVSTTSGLTTSRCICRRSRWKYCAAVVGCVTWMLSGGEHEEALDPGRGVLRALPLVAVREQQDQPGGLPPLVLGGDDELVDDDLRAVDEVAELRLPQRQRVLAVTE